MNQSDEAARETPGEDAESEPSVDRQTLDEVVLGTLNAEDGEVETGEEPAVLLTLELEVGADAHDGGKREDLLVERLAEVGTEHDEEDALSTRRSRRLFSSGVMVTEASVYLSTSSSASSTMVLGSTGMFWEGLPLMTLSLSRIEASVVTDSTMASLCAPRGRESESFQPSLDSCERNSGAGKEGWCGDDEKRVWGRRAKARSLYTCSASTSDERHRPSVVETGRSRIAWRPRGEVIETKTVPATSLWSSDCCIAWTKASARNVE